MKKILIIMLALVLCISVLAACSKDDAEKNTDDSSKTTTAPSDTTTDSKTTTGADESNTPNESSTPDESNTPDESTAPDESENSGSTDDPNGEIAVGTVLDKPELDPTGKDVRVEFTMIGLGEDGVSAGSMIYACENKDGVEIMYINISGGDIVIEHNTETDDYTLYAKDQDAEEFTTVEDDGSMALMLMMIKPMLGYGLDEMYGELGYKFKKCENVTAPTGEVCVYEMFMEEMPEATVDLWLDAETGIVVKMAAEGETMIEVTSLSTDNLGIPEYK